MRKSAKKLNKDQERKLTNQLKTLISDLRHPREIDLFFNSFFTETEQIVFTKRLAIAQMLSKKHPYSKIRNDINVSSATISNIAEIMEKDGIKIAVNKIRQDKVFEKWARTINKILD